MQGVVIKFILRFWSKHIFSCRTILSKPENDEKLIFSKPEVSNSFLRILASHTSFLYFHYICYFPVDNDLDIFYISAWSSSLGIYLCKALCTILLFRFEILIPWCLFLANWSSLEIHLGNERPCLQFYCSDSIFLPRGCLSLQLKFNLTL